MVKQVLIGLFLLLLAACQTTPSNPPPIGTVTRPDLVTLINWDRSPVAVIFRAEVATSDTISFERRSDIADCTIYGDNRVVFTTPTGVGSGLSWQLVSDEAIRLMVEEFMLEYQIYNQSSGIDTIPEEQRPEYTETVILVVNGQAHRADALGGWPEGYFPQLTERCRAVADSPAELLPVEAYVSAQVVPYNDSRPTISWDPASGIDLSTLTEERIWHSGPAMQMLWTAQRESGADVQFRQEDTIYRVAVEVPGVTRYSPPPP
jgi:hypothetical protein